MTNWNLIGMKLRRAIRIQTSIPFSMRYHGNYCGPNWSAGKRQSSVVSDLPALDEFDESCKVHDAAYAENRPLKAADYAFAADNLMTLHPKRWIAGGLVGIQGFMRPLDRINTTTTNTITYNMSLRNGTATKRNPSLRTAKPSASSKQNQTQRGNDIVRMAPVAVSTRRTGASASIKPHGSGVVITHRTFLGAMTNHAAFTPTGFPLNPGMSSTFPWLGSVASRYDKYRFTKLRFEYRSVVSTGTNGVAMMSFDYNAADALPSSKLIQAQTIPNSENNVWMGNDLVIPCDNTWRFVRQGVVPGDIKTYDFGTMCLSTVYGNNAVGGELYVEYTVELEKPSEPSNLAQYIDVYLPTPATPFSGTYSSVGVAQPWVKTSTTTLVCLVPGTYIFSCFAVGTVILSHGLPTIASLSGGIVTTIFDSVPNGTGTLVSRTFKVVAGRDDTLTFSAVLTATSVTNYFCAISPWY